MMNPLRHSVRKQTLKVECDSVEVALGLRSRLGDFNGSHLLPIVERVFSEAAIEGRQIRIERLDVNLGNISLSEFEAEVPMRLYRRLKEAVEQAISSPLESSQQPESMSRIDLIEWYLLRGTLPFWGPGVDSFSLGSSFADLARNEPAALARLVRKAGANGRGLERIVHQLSAAELRHLIAVLDPEHASLILAYMADLSEIHREAPIARVTDAEFDHVLSVLVLSYLVCEAGSQFNRKMFVASILRGFSIQAGVEYEDVLATLGQALRRTLMRHGFPSSLPAVIVELLHDSGVPPTAVDLSFSTLAETDPFELVRLVRRHASDPGWIERLVNILSVEAIVRLIGLLEPEQASMIVEFLFDVREVHREQPVLDGDPGKFDRLLWSLALTYLVQSSRVQNRGSQFNRKAFLETLVRRLAESEGLDFDDVLETLRLGLMKAETAAPLKSSLPGVLASLLEDLGRRDENAQAKTPTLHRNAAALKTLLLRSADIPDSMIEKAFSHDDMIERPDILLAAVRMISAGDARRILSRILPSVDEPGSLIAEALRNAVERADDPQAFYAQLIAAVLRGDPLDFEEFAVAAYTPVSERAAGVNAAAVQGLLRAFEALPASERPQMESIRALVLAATLQWGSTSTMDSGFFTRVIQSVFPAGVPDRIRDLLMAGLPADAANRPQPVAGLSLERMLGALLSDEQLRPDEVWIQSFDDAMESGTQADRAAIRALLKDPQRRTRLARMLPESSLARLIQFLEPRRSRELLQAAEILSAAWSLTVPGSRSTREPHWAAILELVAGTSPTVERLTAVTIENFTKVADAETTQTFRRNAERLADTAGRATLRTALKPIPEKAQSQAPLQPIRKTMENAARSKDPVYIGNAGLVLLSPFLPHLFSSLNMQEKDEKGRNTWRDHASASRAVHLLQYLVDERTSAPEPLLVLNKILCGLQPATPVQRDIEISAGEKEVCASLLKAVLANWTIISNTSVAGLRETFLQREGKLESDGEKWKLHVQRKTLDVLVDQIPWSFGLVFHDWMPGPVHVTW